MAQRNVDILVGLQCGSEAKGKLISAIASGYNALVRTGSVNAAHTTYFNDKGYPWHQLPCGALHAPGAWLVLGAGAQIDLKYLNREVQWLKDNDQYLMPGWGPVSRVMIDPSATIIDEVDTYAENGFQDVCGPQWYNPTSCEFHNGDVGPGGETKPSGGCEGCSLYPSDSLHRALGSTTHGSGYNLIRKLARIDPDKVHAGLLRDKQGKKVAKVKLVADLPELAPYLCDTAAFLNELNDSGGKILLEGTQGAGLSLHHSDWPTTTSRDTNAANWLMEAGLSPQVVNKVYGVARTFPIRVAGNSGPMASSEIAWEDVTRFAYGLPSAMTDAELNTWLTTNNKKMFKEITTATKRMRRVFTFSERDFKMALAINRPDELMLSFVDYLNADDFGKSSWEDLSLQSKDWITTLESKLEIKFKWLSTGPKAEDMIVR